MACRRRETSDTNVSIFCYIFSSFWYLCLSLSHRENQGMLLPVSRDVAAGRTWGLFRSGKQTKPDPVSRDDAVAQIWGLYRSGKQTKPDPALRPSSRYKSTKNHSKPVAPCPLESSTVHGDALNKAESSCVTKAATLGSFLSAQKYWFNHSTKMEVFPATTSSICDSVLNNRRSMPTMRRNTRKLGFPLVGLFLNVDPSVKHRPITKSGGSSPQFLKSRSVLPYLLVSPLYVMSRFLNLYGRRRYRRRSSTSMFWSCCYLLKILVKTESLSSGLKHYIIINTSTKLVKTANIEATAPWISYEKETIQEASPAEEDWKKQVDSKKIFAQPHQSATANPSRQGAESILQNRQDNRIFIESDAKSAITAITSQKLPINLTEIIEDILTMTSSFRALPFRFVPRFDIVDDLAKNAVWSMTLGTSSTL